MERIDAVVAGAGAVVVCLALVPGTVVSRNDARLAAAFAEVAAIALEQTRTREALREEKDRFLLVSIFGGSVE